MSYNPKAANPFAPGRSEWSSNNLILRDANLREKAGVTVLDREVSEVFQLTQRGGARGAPFSVKNYGSPDARFYTQEGGGLPRHYFDNSQRW